MNNLVYFFITKINNVYYKNGKILDSNCIKLNHIHSSREEILKSVTLIKELATVYRDQYEGIPLILAIGKKRLWSSNYKIISEQQLSKEELLNLTDDKLLVDSALNDLELKAYKGEPYMISEIVSNARYAIRGFKNKDLATQFICALPFALAGFIKDERIVTPFSAGMKLKHKNKGYIVKTTEPFAPSNRYLICLSPEDPKDLNELLSDIYFLNKNHKRNFPPVIGESYKYVTERMNLQFSQVHQLFEIIGSVDSL